MSLKIYNSLSRQLEDFVPIKEDHVTMYSCGPTVYDYFHIGNARTFLVSDIIRRYLEYKGYRVRLVQNLTDIDDKIIHRANEQGVDTTQLAQQYIDGYFADSEGLGIRPADVHPCATDHIAEIIDLIQDLIQKGYAYECEGDIYYRVSRFGGYGKLSNRNLEDLLAGARVEVNHRKEDPRDFDLWKAVKPDEPWWDSPWGKGRPGWHIECSAMAIKHLGETIDIHAGGQDLQFPHHENEIAQSEAVTGKPFARYWVHTAFLRVNGDRMGKSEGNFIFIRDALKEYTPETIRHFLLSAHYRHPLDYNQHSLAESRSAVRRLQNSISSIQQYSPPDTGPRSVPSTQSRAEPVRENDQLVDSTLTEAVHQMRTSFERAMDNDFNTASAMGAVYTLVGQVNRRLQHSDQVERPTEVELGQVYQALITTCQILGIYSQDKSMASDDLLVEPLMNLILELRQSARQRKDWETADQIRNQLAELSIELKDSKSGTTWQRQ